MVQSILIVDDDRAIGEIIQVALSKEGYEAAHVKDANAAQVWLKKKKIDLLLLDFNLPGLSGMQFLEILKKDAKTASLPVIMLTVRGEETHKVKGLNIGADDYLVKPVSMTELMARVKALLRRAQRAGRTINVHEAEGIRLDLDLREARIGSQKIELTQTEFNLLSTLINRRGVVMTYETLSKVLSEGSKDITSGSLYVHINSLRKRLGSKGKCIETVHGIGYKFSALS